MKKKTTEVLLEIGVPFNIKGFKYIVDAMCLFEEDKQWKNGKLMALYYKIANMNNVSCAIVERSIRYAFEVALQKGKTEIVNKYLVKENATNGNLLRILYFRLSEDE